MYIAEVAPSNIRGTLVSWNQFAIIFGQLVVYFVNFLILGEHTNPIIEKTAQGVYNVLAESDPWTIETGWRYMFGSEAVPAGLFALLICFVPETPRYLAMTGQDEKALHVLSRINGLEKAKAYCEQHPELNAYFICTGEGDKYEIHYTPGMEKLIVIK
jgi:SP family xylose:H+ symportor-like MFS transporter